ncbi:hypothetical protein GCM10009817_30770 [Terrabacter lapilli]|uniref:Uncharacterized protein n=1 Tax=Terrabacter lapilli TaxID=436231 RepID=A0ABN2SI21_9MICO
MGVGVGDEDDGKAAVAATGALVGVADEQAVKARMATMVAAAWAGGKRMGGSLPCALSSYVIFKDLAAHRDGRAAKRGQGPAEEIR